MTTKEYTAYKLRLKPAILDEAHRCFAKYGIRAVKMDDIARNLSISKRTVYELYATKEDLLCEVVASVNELRDKKIQELRQTSDNTMDVLIGVLSMQLETAATTNFNFFQDMVKYPKVVKKFNEFHERQRACSAEFFAKGVEEGFFLPSVDYTVLNRIASGILEMLCADRKYADLAYQELFGSFLYVMIRGFCTHKGIEKIDRFMENVIGGGRN